MIHHYITEYLDDDDGKIYAVAWFQINVFRWCFCLSQRKMEVSPTYQRIVVESDTETPEVIATITPDGVDVADGYRVRLKPTYE